MRKAGEASDSRPEGAGANGSVRAADSAHDRSVSGHGVRHPGLTGVESAPTLNAETPVERTSSPQALPIRIGETIAGKYFVERVIGQGGAGIVFAATNLDLEERVALKFLRPDVSVLPDVIARFAREARAAVSIKSEHVAKVLDVGTLPNGAPFMVMEFLEGRDLWRIMKERGGLPVREAVEYVMQACEALAFAHAKGIVHRDVKPENLFLIENEGLPAVKVLDFGISKAALVGGAAFGSNPSLVTTHNLLGTPAYMSPEQIRASADVDHRTDVWSLGIVLYEILAGKPAFSAATVPQMTAMILESEPAPMRVHRDDVPPALLAVIERCLRKRPEARYQTVADLAEALLPFGPKRARINVERANSTLRRDRVGREEPTAGYDDDTQAGARPRLSLAASTMPAPPEPPLPAAPAPNARPRPARARSTLLLLLGLGALLALAAWAISRATRHDDAASPAASTSTSHAAATNGAPAPTPSPAPTTATALPAPATTTATTAIPSTAPSSTAATAATTGAKAPSKTGKPAAKPSASQDVDLGF